MMEFSLLDRSAEKRMRIEPSQSKDLFILNSKILKLGRLRLLLSPSPFKLPKKGLDLETCMKGSGKRVISLLGDRPTKQVCIELMSTQRIQILADWMNIPIFVDPKIFDDRVQTYQNQTIRDLFN